METKIPLEIVLLEGEESLHSTVAVGMNGEQYRFVIDTGASHTCVDKKKVKHLLQQTEGTRQDFVIGIGGRKATNECINIEEFALGELKIKNYAVLSIRMSHINKVLKTFNKKPIDGLLGCDVLYKYGAVLDYKNSTLTLSYENDETTKQSLESNIVK